MTTIELQGWIIDGYRVTGRTYTQAALSAKHLAAVGAPRDVHVDHGDEDWTTIVLDRGDADVLRAALEDYRRSVLQGTHQARPRGACATLKTTVAACGRILAQLEGGLQ